MTEFTACAKVQSFGIVNIDKIVHVAPILPIGQLPGDCGGVRSGVRSQKLKAVRRAERDN